jgi:hypothetical protein
MSLAVADWLVGIFVMPPAVAYFLMGNYFTFFMQNYYKNVLCFFSISIFCHNIFLGSISYFYQFVNSQG